MQENQTPHDATTEQPSIFPPVDQGTALPLVAQGEVNGGPLGCCLGTVVGLLITFLLITGTSILLTNGGFLGFATIPGAFLGAIGGGYLGWKIGRKLYREYEPRVVKVKARR